MKVSMPLYSKRTRLDHKYRLDKIEKAVSKARFLGCNSFYEIRITYSKGKKYSANVWTM